MPRKPVSIDLAELEKLGRMHATDEEIAAWFGMSRETFARKKTGKVVLEARSRFVTPYKKTRARGNAPFSGLSWH